jgi:hypothetical protein
MSSSILLPYQSLNRWNEKAIQPGPQGSMGDALTQIRIQQSLPDMPVKFNNTFSGANSSKRGSNVQDGQTRSFSDGGRGAEVIVRKRQKFTNVGWRQQNLSGNDRTFQSVMAPQPQVGFRTQVDSILHRQGDAFQVMPGGYGPEPGQLLRGGQVPRVVSGFMEKDPLARGVNSASSIVENAVKGAITNSVVVPQRMQTASNDQVPASVQAEPTRDARRSLMSRATDLLGNAVNTMANIVSTGADDRFDLSGLAVPTQVSKNAPPPPPMQIKGPPPPPSMKTEDLYVTDIPMLSPPESVMGGSPSNRVSAKPGRGFDAGSLQAASSRLRKAAQQEKKSTAGARGVDAGLLQSGLSKLKKVEQKKKEIPTNELQAALSQALAQRRRSSGSTTSPTSSNDEFFDAPSVVQSVVEPRKSTRANKGQRDIAGKFTGK